MIQALAEFCDTGTLALCLCILLEQSERRQESLRPITRKPCAGGPDAGPHECWSPSLLRLCDTDVDEMDLTQTYMS